MTNRPKESLGNWSIDSVVSTSVCTTITVSTPTKWNDHYAYRFIQNLDRFVQVPLKDVEDTYDSSDLSARLNNQELAESFANKKQYLGYSPVCASCKYNIYCLAGQYPHVCPQCRGLIKVYCCSGLTGLTIRQRQHLRSSLEMFRVSSACPLLHGNFKPCRLCWDEHVSYVNKTIRIKTVHGKLLYNKRKIAYYHTQPSKHPVLDYVRRGVNRKSSDTLHQRQGYRYFKKHKR